MSAWPDFQAPFQILFFTTLGIALMRFGSAAAISADRDDRDDADSEALQEARPWLKLLKMSF